MELKKFNIELNSNRLNYSSWVSEKYNYIYIENPKVACTKIKSILQVSEGFELPKNIMDIHYRKNGVFVKNLLDIWEKEKENLDWKYFIFSFVRNPFSRIESAFKDKVLNSLGRFWENYRQEIKKFNNLSINEGIEFIHFCRYIESIPDSKRDIHWRSQSKLLFFDQINYDFIGKFESFNLDMDYVVKKLCLSIDLFVINQKINSSGNECLQTSETVEIIKHVYKNDFINFKYKQSI